MSEDYERIMDEVRRLEREHFKEPCHPSRCSHLTSVTPPEKRE
jgi:hypothetical protein